MSSGWKVSYLTPCSNQNKINNKQCVMEHNDHIEFGLVLALYSNDESSIFYIKTENLNSVGGFLLKRFVISSY